MLKYTLLFLMTSFTAATFAARDPYVADELRDYLILHKADIAKRKAAGQIYVTCVDMDGSLRCNRGYLAQTCTAPKGGHCSAVFASLGNTAACDASDGATCTAEIALALDNLDNFHEQMKLATS